MDYRIDDIGAIIENNGGIVSGKELKENGIDRLSLYKLLAAGVLKKEFHGNYTMADDQPDEYAILQKRSDKIVFSHATALYLHGMSDRIPHTIDITVPQGDNISRIKKDYPNTRFHYCKKELWDLGIIEIVTPQGYRVRAYDRERCICDLVRNKKDVDTQIFIQALRGYFSGTTSNPRKIVKYAKEFNVEKRIRSYMEVLQ